MKHRHSHVQHKIKRFKPKKSLLKRPLFWIILGVIVLSTSAIYICFYFPGFQVASVKVLGNKRVDANAIEITAWQSIQKNTLGISYKTIFLVNSAALRQSLLTDFTKLEEVMVKKNGLKTIDITVIERTPVAIFCDTTCFSIDKNGVIYEAMPAIDPSDMVIRKSMSHEGLALGDNVVDKNLMDGILKIKNSLKNNFQLETKEVLAENPLVVTTNEEWKMYFDPKLDINLEILKMESLLKELSPDTRNHLQYIYLQYRDRAYYK